MIPLVLLIAALLVFTLGTLWLCSVRGPDALGALLLYLVTIPTITLFLLILAAIVWRLQGHYITFH